MNFEYPTLYDQCKRVAKFLNLDFDNDTTEEQRKEIVKYAPLVLEIEKEFMRESGEWFLRKGEEIKATVDRIEKLNKLTLDKKE